MGLPGWQTQIIQYTGNGVVGRTIPTNFSLASGVVAVWVFEDGSFTPQFRHNGAGMTGTATVGSSGLTANMITGFTVAGFTVSTGGGVLGQVNQAGSVYTAVVLRDSTSDRRYMRVGNYPGTGTHGVNFTVQATNPRHITNNTFTAADVGMQVVAAFTFTLTSWESASSASCYPSAPLTLVGTPLNGTVQADNRLIITGASPPWLPTHVWIFGRGAVYRSVEFSGDSSIALAEEAKPEANQIQGFRLDGAAAGFEVGDDNNVNNSGLSYYWVAFKFDTTQRAAGFFTSYKIPGTTAATDRVSNLKLTPPQVSVALRMGTTLRRRRQPDHLGLKSLSMGGTTDNVAGITAHGPGDSLDLGENIAAVGADVYGFVFGSSYDGGPALPNPCAIVLPPGASTSDPGCASPVLP